MRILLLAMAALVAIGCRKEAATPVAAPPAAPVEPESPSAARDRGVAYLLSKQSDDGAWRSEVYGHFRGGDALTPLVIVSLQRSPESPEVNNAIERGVTFMSRYVVDDAIDAEGKLVYPVYSAALMAKALSEPRLAKHLASRDAWVQLLIDWQMSANNRWEERDWQYGGWGYAGIRPRKPAEGPIPEALEANISATAYAVEGLRAAGLAVKHPVFGRALVFVNRCQNFAADNADPEYDDGGFFFTPGDPFRNKAGQILDSKGKARFRSYGSATADGRRCQQACISPLWNADGGKRIEQAIAWFDKYIPPNSVGESLHQHGRFSPDREADRNAAIFYYAAAFSECNIGSGAQKRRQWIQSELTRRQRPDGSWANDRNTMREDDPLLATALAVMALR
jgi:squalene-hopene/tetraprenyl-beta-curcumene cyclase